MSTPHHQVGGTLTAELRQRLGTLAHLSRTGAVGAATILTQLAAMDRLACQLAVAEDTLDRLTDEAREIALTEREGHRAHMAAFLHAQAHGKVVILEEYRYRRMAPCAVPFHDHHGGAA